MIEEKSLSLENALLVGVINSRQNEEQSKEYLDELEFLTYTAGGKVLKRFTQKIDPPNPKTFIGSGKMQEVLEFVKTQDVSSVIFDDELTPAQQGNIEKMLKSQNSRSDRTHSRYFCSTRSNQLCANPSGTSTIPIFTPPS